MTKNTDRNNLILQLVHQFRILQRINRFVTEDMESELSIVESLLLYELDADPTRGISEFAHIFELDKATISRTIQNLQSKTVLRVSKDSKDARRLSIEITSHGQKLLRQNDIDSNQLLSWFTSFLNIDEQKKLSCYFHDLADAFGTAPASLRKNDHPLRVGMRRLAISLGYLKNNFMDSGFSPAAWQVLASIHHNPHIASPAFLSNLLATPHSYMSRLLSDLAQKGCLLRPRSSIDSRARELSLTKLGIESYHLIEKKAFSKFKDVLVDLSDTAVADFVSLFSFFIREPTDGVRFIDKNTTVKVAQHDYDTAQLRGFIARSAVKDKWEHSLPAHICAPFQISVEIKQNNKTIGAIVFDTVSQGNLCPLIQVGVESLSEIARLNLYSEISTLVTQYVRGISTPPVISVARYNEPLSPTRVS